MSLRVNLSCTVIISGWMHRLHYCESWPSSARNSAGCPDVAERLGAVRIKFWQRLAQRLVDNGGSLVPPAQSSLPVPVVLGCCCSFGGYQASCSGSCFAVLFRG